MRPLRASRSNVHCDRGIYGRRFDGGRLFALIDYMQRVHSILIELKRVMQSHHVQNVASFI